jgi:alkylation response protein AidB-like acyl-CoA dehydrogenase
VIAQTHREKGHKGINVLIVDRNSPGITLGPHEDKMGMRSSDTHSVMFNDVKVPKENRIGEDGFGFKFAMKTLEGGRIGIAAQALGIASGALKDLLNIRKSAKLSERRSPTISPWHSNWPIWR